MEEDATVDYIEEYKRRVKKINPPGLPFIAMGGRTRLIHLEMKYPDWVPCPPYTLMPGDPDVPDKLINFEKCAQMAENVDYFLLFQKVPYPYQVNERIRVSIARLKCILYQAFLESLMRDENFGFEDDFQIDKVFFMRSLEIEPRNTASTSTSSAQDQELFSKFKRLYVKTNQLTPAELKIHNELSVNRPSLQVAKSPSLRGPRRISTDSQSAFEMEDMVSNQSCSEYSDNCHSAHFQLINFPQYLGHPYFRSPASATAKNRIQTIPKLAVLLCESSQQSATY
ncbi:hypothetical protein Ciccas_011427 [Cichlidogyrus casuarinus]|uniref:Uncharacterized protein n=1 Tax=Cichlidogyrus casuarinus TaxID=1844966 RepID=A0ABD2PR92_9PLAT